MATGTAEPLLEARDLSVSIHGLGGVAEVLDQVALSVPRGRIVGVVGESGCGKSTLIRAILGILPRGGRVDGGVIRFAGQDLLAMTERQLGQQVRGRQIGFIPQDPFLALNPVFKVGTQLLEILAWHDPDAEGSGFVRRFGRASRRRHRAQLTELLRAVQIPDPEHALERYPHQFSGGQRQRLLIAGALACRPRLVIADEPTTALDVTTQQQILRLLRELAAEFAVSMIFVTHDFGVVAELCDEVTVMYAGQTVEHGPTAEIIERPRHPYTEALLGCHPDRSPDLSGIPGTVPSAVAPPHGCRFHTRCRHALEVCRTRRPEGVALGQDHQVSCVLHQPDARGAA